jgi:hypothetical protein
LLQLGLVKHTLMPQQLHMLQLLCKLQEIKAVRDAEVASLERLEHMPAGAGVPVSCPELPQLQALAAADADQVWSVQKYVLGRILSALDQVKEENNAVVRDAVQALSADPPPLFMTSRPVVVNAMLEASLALRRYETAVSPASDMFNSNSDTLLALAEELNSALELFPRLVAAAGPVTASRLEAGQGSPLRHAPCVSLTDGTNALVSLQQAIVAAKAVYQELATAEEQSFRAARTLHLAFAAAAPR